MKERLFENVDCMEIMREYPDNYFDLAIVDPPYGIGFDGEVSSMTISPNMGKKRKKRWNNRKANQYIKKKWDKETPLAEYWEALFRVSENQIVWGGNHFKLPQSRGWIFWDKKMDKGFSLADGELAWSSFDKGVKKFEYLWAGFKKKKPIKRIHPTQKPVALYRWLLQNYAKPGDRLLDTHVGSASSLIAFEEAGHEYVACELDSDYYKDAKARLGTWRSQGSLFKPEEIVPKAQGIQTSII
mgnify:CR=1 FL=1